MELPIDFTSSFKGQPSLEKSSIDFFGLIGDSSFEV